MKSLLTCIAFVILIQVVMAGTVDRLEYFFDADPGWGNGTLIYSRNLVDIEQLISSSSLSPGFHRIYVRARNGSGQWGMPQSTSFYIPLPTPPAQAPYGNVARIEYFFDADPGPGNGTQIFGRVPVDVNQLISTASLSPGFHRLYVRAKNSAGKWAMPQSTSFYIPILASPALPYKQITRLEYWLDSDPGFGNGTQISVAPATNLNISFPLILGQIEHGNHKLYIRAKNSDGVWGMPASALFSDGVPAHLTINIVDGSLFITWEDLYTIDSYLVYSAPDTDAPYVLDTSGAFGPNDWTAPLPADPKRFYRVTSTYMEP